MRFYLAKAASGGQERRGCEMTAVAGRELDAEVAEKVMGWRRYPIPFNRGQAALLPNLAAVELVRPGMNLNGFAPAYSTDIAAAWQVVEKMVADGKVVVVKGDGLRDGERNPRWTVLVDGQPRTDAHTAALAICHAALAALEGK